MVATLRFLAQEPLVVPSPALIAIPLLLITVFGIVTLWGIIDAAVRPDPAWTRAGQNKIVWVVVQIFVPLIPTLVYFFVIRPQVKRAGGGTPEA